MQDVASNAAPAQASDVTGFALDDIGSNYDSDSSVASRGSGYSSGACRVPTLVGLPSKMAAGSSTAAQVSGSPAMAAGATAGAALAVSVGAAAIASGSNVAGACSTPPRGNVEESSHTLAGSRSLITPAQQEVGEAL